MYIEKKLNLHQKVFVSDLTLRDGFQAEQRVISTDAKLFIINSLIDAGFKEMEVTAFAPPKYQPQFRDCEDVIANLPKRDDVVYSCVTMGRKATERAFQTKQQGYRVDRILVAVLPASESMNKLVLGMNYAETWEWICDCVKKARDLGMKVNGVLTGIFSPPAPEEADVNIMDRALDFCNQLLEIGVDDIEHPDHLGEATPDKTYEYFNRVMEKFPNPNLHIFHVHDARGMGLACYFAAMQAGIIRFETTLGGLGGWPANFVDGIPVPGLKGVSEVSRHPGLVSTEDFLVMLDGIGIKTDIDVDKILELGRIVEKIVGRQLWSFCLGTDDRPGSGKIPENVQTELKTERR
jgi:hydroxymethylglutaryl-CoA lyase